MADDRTLALRTETPPDVAALATLIKAMLPNGKNLTDQEAVAGAMYGKAHGLDPFKQEYFIIPGRGIYPGYRGEMKLQQDREYYTQTRPLRGDEAADHEIAPGDTARIVELYQPDLMARMRTLGIPYQPIAGLGIVRKAEKQSAPPTGRSWAWKAEQRALKDAMRHMQGGADILEETVDMRLAEAEDHADAVLAEVRNLPEAEQRAQFAERVNAMRGDPERNPFDDPEPPSDAEFRKLTSATEERAEQSAAGAKANGRAMASLQLGGQIAQWNTWVAGFADIFPYYAISGKADIVHILRALASEGFPIVTPENLTDACKALEVRAGRKVAGK